MTSPPARQKPVASSVWFSELGDGAATQPQDDRVEGVDEHRKVELASGSGDAGALPAALGPVLRSLSRAVGGWWASGKVGEAIGDWSEEDERFYRNHFLGSGSLDEYEDVRFGYILGHVAGRNPGYRHRTFTEIEPDLKHGFMSGDSGFYYALRPYMRAGYDRSYRF